MVGGFWLVCWVVEDGWMDVMDVMGDKRKERNG